MGIPLRTLAPCLWCGKLVCIRIYHPTPDALLLEAREGHELRRYLWQHWLSPVLGDEHHCIERKDAYGHHRNASANPGPG
jgi:hypothetical protein